MTDLKRKTLRNVATDLLDNEDLDGNHSNFN